MVVPKIFTYTPEEIKIYGIRISDPRVVKVDTSNDPVDVFISPSRMFKIFQEGGTIRIRKVSDIPRIYNIVQNYLLQWKRLYENTINIPYLPEWDLAELDHLAQEIFNNSKYYFNNEDAPSMLYNPISERAKKIGINENDLAFAMNFKREQEESLRETSNEDPERESFEEFFQKMNRRHKR